MNQQQKKQRNSNRPSISPIQYIAINKTPQASKFIVDFGKMPASSMPDLQIKMASVVKQFGDQAKKELAKLHPDTEWIMKAMTGDNKMEGGITDNDFVSAHGKKCNCDKCVGMEKHSNFVTNYRSDADSSMANSVMELNAADGSTGRLADPSLSGNNNPSAAKSKMVHNGMIFLGVLAVGVLIIAIGERYRPNHA